MQKGVQSPDGRFPWQDLPVLVTGGAGFIGSHLVDALLEKGARVRVLDDLSFGSLDNLEKPLAAAAIDWRQGDIRDLGTCQEAARGQALIFHQAAWGSVPRSMKLPAETIAVNVAGTANIFTAARDQGVGRVVYASSSSVYGESQELPKREGGEGQAISPYALSKVMNEDLAQVFHRCYGLETVGLRYFNVYGPRQNPQGPYAAAVPRFLAAVAAGEPVEIYGDGEQSRDFTYVGDAVASNLRAAEAPAAACGRAFNVGGGQSVTINDLVKRIHELQGRPLKVRHLPPREGDIRHSLASLEAVEEALGYRPMTELEEGLRKVLAGPRS
jgi:nucleoside-diphosphate-sugar epimerase